MTAPETIEVPGDPTAWKTHNIPPIAVTLPLIAKARIGYWHWGLPFLWFPAFYLAGYGVAVKVDGQIEPLSPIPDAAARIVLLALAVVVLAAWLDALRDLTLRGPALIIDSKGFQDFRRLYAKVAWRDVETVAIHSHTRWPLSWTMAVVVLRNPMPVRRGFLIFWRRTSKRVVVELNSIDRDGWIAAKSMRVLALRSGAEDRNRFAPSAAP